MFDAAERLRLVLAASAGISELREPASRPGPGRWSPIEILGHLVDSAVHNLVRFTEAATADAPYPVRGYGQDALVAVNAYRDADLAEVSSLWRSLDVRIAQVLAALPAASLSSAVVLPGGEEATLGYLAADYLAHLEHHLAQVGIHVPPAC